jgi:hypothetical protein
MRKSFMAQRPCSRATVTPKYRKSSPKVEAKARSPLTPAQAAAAKTPGLTVPSSLLSRANENVRY